jgi:lipocalin-like protein
MSSVPEHFRGATKEDVMTRTFVSAIAFTCLLILPHSAAAQDTTSVVGVWKLTSLVTKEVATGKTVHPLGESPIGYTIYTRGGHFISATTAANRKAPAGASPTDAERIELHKTAVFTSGTYRQEGNKVIIRYDQSWHQAWTGTERVGTFEIAGKTLTSAGTPFKSSLTGLDVVAISTLERVE